jgi:hypothetical protein
MLILVRAKRSDEDKVDDRHYPRQCKSIVREHISHGTPFSVWWNRRPQKCSKELGEWTTPREPIPYGVKNDLTKPSIRIHETVNKEDVRAAIRVFLPSCHFIHWT